MKPKQPERKLCVVCRAWFRPAPSAAQTQVVCSAVCRAVHRRKLARRRRRREVQDHRVDERERQRECRERRRAAAATGEPPGHGPPGHAPPSAHILLELQENLAEFVADLGDLLRASLHRRLPALLRQWGAAPGTAIPAPAARSRATLGPEASERTRESG